MEVTGPRVYQATAVRIGLKTLKVGLKLNSAYTLSNCLATATRFTGKTYPVRKSSIDVAIADLDRWIDDAKETLSVRG